MPAFVRGAVGTAPFPLPRTTERVSRFFAFASDLEARPTLPAVALQRYALPRLGEWTRLLSEAGLPVGQGDLAAEPGQLASAGALTAYMQALRRAFVEDEGLEARLRAALARAWPDARTGRLLTALIGLIMGPTAAISISTVRSDGSGRFLCPGCWRRPRANPWIWPARWCSSASRS